MAKMNTAYKTAWNFVKKSASGAFHAVTNAAKSIWHGFTNLFGEYYNKYNLQKILKINKIKIFFMEIYIYELFH